MFNALYSREGTNKTKRKNMFDTLSRQFKELLKFPFIHKIRNGSKHYAGRYLDGKAYYYYDEHADGRVYEGSFYYLGKYYYTLTARRPTMSAAPICTAASMAAGSSTISATVPTSCSTSTISRAVTMASISISHPARTAEMPLTIFSLWK